jgi:hypothetical protein
MDFYSFAVLLVIVAVLLFTPETVRRPIAGRPLVRTRDLYD